MLREVPGDLDRLGRHPAALDTGGEAAPSGRRGRSGSGRSAAPRRAGHERAVAIAGEQDALDDRLPGGLGVDVGDVAEGRRQSAVASRGPGEAAAASRRPEASSEPRSPIPTATTTGRSPRGRGSVCPRAPVKPLSRSRSRSTPISSGIGPAGRHGTPRASTPAGGDDRHVDREHRRPASRRQEIEPGSCARDALAFHRRHRLPQDPCGIGEGPPGQGRTPPITPRPGQDTRGSDRAWVSLRGGARRHRRGPRPEIRAKLRPPIGPTPALYSGQPNGPAQHRERPPGSTRATVAHDPVNGR